MQEVILKRAADLAEALYTMPRNNQLSLSLPRSPCSRDRDSNNMSTTGSAGTGFNPYTGQLAVTVHDHGASGQWNDGECCNDDDNDIISNDFRRPARRAVSKSY